MAAPSKNEDAASEDQYCRNEFCDKSLSNEEAPVLLTSSIGQNDNVATITHKRDDEKDYDEAWTSVELVRKHSIFDPTNARCEEISVSQSPVVDEDSKTRDLYGDECYVYIQKKKLWDRRGSLLFYIDTDAISVSETLTDFEISEKAGNQKVNRSKSQLPKNALLQYFGKVLLSPVETSNVDLKKPISTLIDDSTQLVRGKSFFVLFRILRDTLVLEGSNMSKDKKSYSDELSYAKAADRVKVKRKSSTASRLFRKKSTPNMRTCGYIKSRKNSVINLREADQEVDGYTKGEENFLLNKKSTGKRSGLCMDIFLCMGRKSRSTKHIPDTVDEDSPSTSTRTPVHGNSIIDSFDLKSIVYCGTEYTDELGAHLIVWLHQAKKAGESTGVECHAAACDDFQHAKSLATSLGDAIRKLEDGEQ